MEEATHREALSDIENWEKIKSFEVMGSADFSLELLKAEPFSLKVGESRGRKSVNVVMDEEKMLAFASARIDRMDADEKRAQLLEEMTALEASPELSEKVVGMLVETESILGDSGLLSERFLERRSNEGLSIEVVDSGQGYQGMFRCKELLDPNDEKLDNKIEIGLKGNRRFASHLRMLATEAGIPLSEKQSIDLSLLGTGAHEYGHYMEHVASAGPKFTRDPCFQEAAEVSNPLPVLIDGQYEKSGVISERFSQGVGKIVLTKKMESMGFSPEQVGKLTQLALDIDPSEASKYKEMLNWANQKGVSSEGLSSLLREAHSFFKKRGLDREAKKCLSRIRSLGYYVEPYTSADIKGMMDSVR